MEFKYGLQDLEKAAAILADILAKNKIIALEGEMGAGKTTLIIALCKYLGVKDTVSSPTFSIINEYNLPNNETMYHMDLYRLKSDEEAISAGVEDSLYSGAYCVVEWPQNAASILPDNTIHVEIILCPDGSRCLKVKNFQ